MFVKKKPNRSGSTTVVVAEKEKGATMYLKTIGTSSDRADIAEYVREGEAYISSRRAAMCPELDFDGARERTLEAELKATEEFLSRIENVIHDAPKRILDRVFDAVGFHTVGDDTFRSLVTARLSFPSSKRATVEYLKSYFDEDHDLHKIYRYLDGLNDTKREEIQAISVRHTMEVHGGKIGVLFYDVTTLYFDSDKPDKLRKPGFSKDGKHSNPQIVLGLLVGGDGCPLAYSIHEGSKYEGHTMLPVVEDFVVVADAGMMSEANLSDMEAKGYVSNAALTPDAIVEAYYQLYNAEQSFRITKSKLEIRPIFHFNHDRIKAHISICFVALKVYRELDRMLKNNKMKLSVDTVLNIAKTIPTISVKMAESTLTRTLFLTKRHEQIKPLLEEKFWVTQNSSESQ